MPRRKQQKEPEPPQEQRHIDRAAELARQESVEIAVADRNRQIAKGADPDPNVGTGWYPGEGE